MPFTIQETRVPSRLQQKMKEIGVGTYREPKQTLYAMDRDNRWDRVEKAYNAIVIRQPPTAEDPVKNQAIRSSYLKEVYDEEFAPTVLTKKGAPVCHGETRDAVIFNYRADRARELTKAFVLPSFDKFPKNLHRDLVFVTFMEYEAGLPVDVAYPPTQITQTLCRKCCPNAGLV